MFSEAGKRGLARMLVINKLDGDNIKFPELLGTIQSTFGKSCVLFNAPLNPGPKLSGVVSVLHPPASAPAGCPVDLAAARNQLVEAVVEVDETLTEKFLMEEPISDEELLATIPKALAAGKLVPIFCTSAKKDIGVAELLDALVTFGLSPEQGKKRVAFKGEGDKKTEVTLQPDPAGEFVGQVFKAISDKFVGNLSFIRVYSGKYTPDQPLFNTRTGKSARTGGLGLMQGKQQKPISEAIPGDIIAVAKVEDLHLGDTVSNHAGAPSLPTLSFPMPMFGLAVEPKARGDEQKLSGSLAKIANEDPTFQITRDTQTKEMVIHRHEPAPSGRGPAPSQTTL